MYTCKNVLTLNKMQAQHMIKLMPIAPDLFF